MTPFAHPRARILVVEDHADLAEALEVNLRYAGHRVECARDGRDALAFARTRTPDLIVLDLNLPHVDGFTVLRTLREDGLWCPVLILSARGAVADKVEGFRLGADDYLTKPFTVDELLGRVGALLRRAALAAAPAVAAESAGGKSAGARVDTDMIGFSDEALMAKFGLTARQAVVVRLMVQGLTNPEIADALDISRYTARNHVEQVMLKLGVKSRGRIAPLVRKAYAAEQGGDRSSVA